MREVVVERCKYATYNVLRRATLCPTLRGFWVCPLRRRPCEVRSVPL